MSFDDYVYYIMKHVLEWTIINNLWANFLLSISSFVCLYFLAHINRNIWVNKFLAKGDWKGINLSYLHDVNTKNVLMPLGYLPEKNVKTLLISFSQNLQYFSLFFKWFYFWIWNWILFQWLIRQKDNFCVIAKISLVFPSRKCLLLIPSA